MKAARNLTGTLVGSHATDPGTGAGTKGGELPVEAGLAEFAMHAGFVASLLMASSAVGTTASSPASLLFGEEIEEEKGK
jgi:hypothetical protein